MPHRSRLRGPLLLSLVAGLVPLGMSVGATSATTVDADRYSNPLKPRIEGDGIVESCADPSVLRGRGEQRDRWYLYCTTDPLNDADTAGDDPVVFHPVPQLVSRDLVHWRYRGDALPEPPAWAAEGAGIWAPDIVYSRAHDRYYLTFTVTDTVEAVSGEPECNGDSAIGVAVSESPTGPWTTSDTPVVGPRRGGPGCNFFWTFDPDVLGDSIDDSSVLYYGSYYGGVQAQRVTLTDDGMTTAGGPTTIVEGVDREPAVDPLAVRTGPLYAAAVGGRAAVTEAAEDVQITIPNRYEGSNVVKRGDWYYYFGSATNCCNGPLTGYSVFTGRSQDPFGPFIDREGNSLLAGRVGGTPVLSMNGNRWVGTGHNSVFKDRSGQWWTVYHAVDRRDPYFESEPGFTKRPALLDPVTWNEGWPNVRNGRWASNSSMPAPAAQPGETSAYEPEPLRRQRRGKLLDRYTDAFRADGLEDRWSWVRQPEDPSTYEVSRGTFRFDVQTADLTNEPNTASVLVQDAPNRDFVVQTKVELDVPPEGCCLNFTQAGLVLHKSDDAFIKLVHVSIWETRQTEFAKEVPIAPGPGLSRYGNTVVGAPGEKTWLRVVKETRRGDATFTAYTSQDGDRWVRGGTWTHNGLGDDLKIGLVSMGAQEDVDYTAKFSHVRVWALR